MLIGYAKQTFLDLMDWLYICYGKIIHIYLIKNQDTMKTSYHVEELIEIIFDKIETVQETMIAGYSPFS